MLEVGRRLKQVCDTHLKDRYEIIFVNDGSQDKTAEIIAEMAERNPAIVGIDLARNYGHQVALTAGLSFARGERIFVLDADLQDPPELLPDMMRIMDDGANVVYGRRISRKGESAFKRSSAAWFYRVLGRLADVKIPHDAGDFRLMDRKMLEVFLSMPEHYRFVRGMIAWVGLRQEEFPYIRESRFAGTTKYPLGRMVSFAVDAITGFSIAPLRFSFFLSLAFMILGAMLAAYLFIYWLWYGNVRGFTAGVLIFLTFSGIQLFCISIIGEYVGRTYMESKNRPLFVVKQVHAGARSGRAGDTLKPSVGTS
jgi:glycosyltransferase involved in cell wall biosynthesis